MYQLDELRAQRKEIYRIARKHKVKKLYVFGSCARREETPKSDIDFLVKFNSDASLLDLIELHDNLQSFLKKPVDVISHNGIHPFIKEQVLKEAVEF